MIETAFMSLLVSLGIAVVCFVPYLVYQYRRYGQFSASRMVWMGVFLAYLTALVAYTLFPLPSRQWCTTSHSGLLVLDPTVYYRDVWQLHLAGQSWTSVLASWTVMQMALNVVLFLPLGVILRHLWKVGLGRITLIGFGVSLFIELTQLTGNWFTAPCAYRVADINDVITNTAGAFLGAALVLRMPRLAADADVMESVRQWAKPVTRGRRFTAMLFDVATIGLTWLSVEAVLAVAYVVFVNLPDGDRSAALAYGTITRHISEACCLAVVVIFSLIKDGASPGQRLVFLKPQPRLRPARLWLVLRALSVQGLSLVVLFWFSGASWIVILWILADVVWVLARPAGLSFTLTRCDLADARSPMPEGDVNAS